MTTPITPASNSTMSPVGLTQTSADPSTTVTPQQVTQWVDDAAIQSASLPSYTIPSKEVLAPGVEDRIHTVVDVLERPVRIRTFSWSDSDTFDSSLYSASFPEALISSAPNLADKINHFTFLRANVVIRIVVNANTFQCGRLIAYFAPFSSPADIGERFDANSFMSSRTVFPRVILDAASGNTGELTIPYVSYFTHYDLSRGLGDLGSIDIRVLNPLQSGDCTVSVFARFVDNSLEIPTAVPNQLGSFSGVYNAIQAYAQPISSDIRNRILSSLSRVMSSELRDLPKAQVGEAETKASSGKISSTLDKVGAGMVTGGAVLPGWGKLLVPVGWVTRAIAGVAAFFGYSKSSSLSDLNKYVPIPGWGFTNSDGIDASVVLGNSLENYIGPRSDLFGSALDEMDIRYVCKHECFVESFNWGTNGSPGDTIYETWISPGLSTSDQSPPAQITSYNPTAMGYVSSMFRYWRGSIRFKIQVTKTAYHSGRLRISFIPGGVPGQGGYRVDQGYSEVLDLRTSDELEVTIPFVANTIWKTTQLHTSNSSLDNITTTSGTLRVEVLNTLRAPDTVAQQLFCNIWISGGDDIQFAVPDFAKYVPLAAPSDVPRAQVLGQFKDTGFNAMEAPRMFASTDTPPVQASLLSIGEHVQNLRALARRFGYVGSYTITSEQPDLGGLVTSSNYFSEPVTTESALNSHFSPVDYISFLYRFFRGGTRFKAISRSSEPGATLATIEPAIPTAPLSLRPINPDNLEILRTALARGSSFVHVLEAAYNRVLEILVPYFSNTHVSLVRGTSATVDSTMDRSSLVFIGAPLERRLDIYKSTADDFSFGWLVGPPRLLLRPLSDNAVNIDYSTATEVSITGTVSPKLRISFDSDIGGGSYKLYNPGAGVVQVVYDGGPERDADLTDPIGYLIGAEGNYLELDVTEGPGGSFNPVSTLANVQALSIINYIYGEAIPSSSSESQTAKKKKKRRDL